MKYFLPRLEVTGKGPVWSVEILQVALMDFKNAIFFWTRGSGRVTAGVVISGVLLYMEGLVVILVDQTFCRCWRRCPWSVASALGRCLQTSCDVRPGQVV